MVDLKELQKRVYENKINKGFNVTDISKKFCLAYGEMAEAYEFFVLSNAAFLTLFATVVATFSETLPAIDLAT